MFINTSILVAFLAATGMVQAAEQQDMTVPASLVPRADTPRCGRTPLSFGRCLVRWAGVGATAWLSNGVTQDQANTAQDQLETAIMEAIDANLFSAGDVQVTTQINGVTITMSGHLENAATWRAVYDSIGLQDVVTAIIDLPEQYFTAAVRRAGYRLADADNAGNVLATFTLRNDAPFTT